MKWLLESPHLVTYSYMDSLWLWEWRGKAQTVKKKVIDHGKKFDLSRTYNKSTPYALLVSICQNKSVHGLGLGLFMKC